MSKNKNTNNENQKENIILGKLHELIGEKFGNYSRYIIQDRALPDINDGLKPVQRRILYAMHSLKLFHKNPYKKSARVVGDVIGKYHPHGDSSVYEAMVRMAQEWKMSIPLVDMHGNKGSVDGDSAAAMRYTEARLMEISSYIIGDIDKKITAFNPNFDDTELEPTVFPTIIPNLLLNGSTGIASGYSTNIPPHNFNELMEGVIHLLKNESTTINDIFKIIKGPDFPTGGIIEKKKDILAAYKTGSGKITIRSKVQYNQKRNAIIISEIPYEVNKSSLVKRIDELVNSPSVSTIKEVIDETDKTGLQIAVILKNDVNYNSVLNFLYKKTDLEKSYSFNMIAIKDKSPVKFSLMEYLYSFKKFLIKNYTSLFRYELDKILKRLEVVEGIIKAIPILDEIIALIRKAKNKGEARESLMNTFKFTYNQAEAILNLRLYRLSTDDIYLFEQELNELKDLEKHYKKGLNNLDYLTKEIIKNLEEVNEKFTFPRRSKIQTSGEKTAEFNIKDLMREEILQITLTKKGSIKVIEKDDIDNKINKIPLDDLVISQEETNSFNSIFIFTNYGKYYSIEAFKLRKHKPRELGENITSYFGLAPDEEIINVLYAKENEIKETSNTLIIATKDSSIKKIKYENLSTSTTKNGVKLIKLVNDDKVISYINNYDDDGLVNAISKNGTILRYPSSNISLSSNSSQGVTNIKFDNKQDEIIGIIFQDTKSIKSTNTIVSVDSKGQFRRSQLNLIPETSRAKKGKSLNKNLKDDLIGVFLGENNYPEIHYLTEGFKSNKINKKDIKTSSSTTSKITHDIKENLIYVADGEIIKLEKNQVKKNKKQSTLNVKTSDFFGF